MRVRCSIPIAFCVASCFAISSRAETIPLPELGKELSKVPGVHLVRVPNDGLIVSWKGWSPYSMLLFKKFKKAIYGAHEVELAEGAKATNRGTTAK